MNGNGSKLHGILLKYKIKVRSKDHELRQPLQENMQAPHRWRCWLRDP
jgi:hypothetical protein